MRDFLKDFFLGFKIFGRVIAVFVVSVIGFFAMTALIGGMLWWFNELFGAVISILLTVLICGVLVSLGFAISEIISKKKGNSVNRP